MEIERAKRRVRLRDLETLVAVVEAGGMRKASLSLHLTQSAISKAVGELEAALGLRLLERGRRGVEPTNFGEALVRRSKVVFDELAGALHELADLADPTAGEVRLGCMETLHAGLVGAVVERLLLKQPRMRIVLETGQSPDLINVFLRERLVEFVVARPLTLPLPPEVEGEPLYYDQLRVVVGSKSPFANRRRIELAELADAHWILGRNEVAPGSPTAEAFAAAGLEMPRRVVVSGSLHTRYNLLETGRFVTVVPHSLLPFDRNRSLLRTVPISLPRWRSPTMILTLRGRTLGPAAMRFLDMLREMAGPLAAEPAVPASSSRRHLGPATKLPSSKR